MIAKQLLPLAGVLSLGSFAGCSYLLPLDGLTGGADGGGGSITEDGSSEAGFAEPPFSNGPDAGSPDARAAEAGTPDAHDSGRSSDAGTAADGDASAPPPFAKLVQIDVSSILKTNTVATTRAADPGAPLVWADGAFGQHDFATEAEIRALMPDAGYVGLPNDAHFAGNGATVPSVRLAWNDGVNDANSVILRNALADAGTTSLAFPVPKANYEQLQIYVTGTHGTAGVASNLSVTLTYADHTTSRSAVVVPAWDSDAATLSVAGEHVLVSGLSPVTLSPRTLTTGFNVSVFAIDLDPDPSKSLVDVALTDLGGDASQYDFETVIFYGATGW